MQVLGKVTFFSLCWATRMNPNLPREDFLSLLFFLDALKSQAALISPYNLF